MRFVETHREKEGLALVFLEEPNRFGRDLAISVVFVAAFGIAQKRHRRAEPALRREIRDVRLERGLVDTRRIDDFLPRSRVVEAARADVTRIAVVVDFSNPRGVIAVLTKELRDGDDVRQPLAKVILEIEHLGRIRAQSGHDRRATRTTERKLTIGTLEADAACSQFVDIRRLHERRTVAAEVVVHVVDSDEEDVGFGGRE